MNIVHHVLKFESIGIIDNAPPQLFCESVVDRGHDCLNFQRSLTKQAGGSEKRLFSSFAECSRAT